MGAVAARDGEGGSVSKPIKCVHPIDEIYDLTKQRDELVAALRDLLYMPYPTTMQRGLIVNVDALETARALLAKIEKEGRR